MVFFDLGSSVKVASTLIPQTAGAATTTDGTWIDTQGSSQCCFVINTGALGGSGTSATYQVFEANESDGTGSLLVATSPATGALTASTTHMCRIETVDRRRYLSVKVTTVGTSSTLLVSAVGVLTPNQSTDATAPGVVATRS